MIQCYCRHLTYDRHYDSSREQILNCKLTGVLALMRFISHFYLMMACLGQIHDFSAPWVPYLQHQDIHSASITGSCEVSTTISLKHTASNGAGLKVLVSTQ